MNNLHSKTIAFTGHRFIPFERQPMLKSLLRQSIANIYKQGYFTYYCGMAMGFDLLAAEVIISMKEQGFSNLKLIAVVPYRNQSERFSQRDKQRYNNALSKADKVIVLNEGKLEMMGTPREVFRNEERLNQIGLTVPQMTSVFHQLGKILPESGIQKEIFTVEEGAEEILRLLKNSDRRRGNAI